MERRVHFSRRWRKPEPACAARGWTVCAITYAMLRVLRVLVTAPDRLARHYVHQMLLMEEFERGGCQIEFTDQPMSRHPHDQLLVQIRGAVAEYERSLIGSPHATGPSTEVSSWDVTAPLPTRPMGIAWILLVRVTRQACGWSQPRRRWEPRCFTDTVP